MMKLYWVALATLTAVVVPTLVTKTNYVKEYKQIIDVPIITSDVIIEKPILVNKAWDKKSVVNITPPSKRTLTLYGEVDESSSKLADKITELSVKSPDPIYLLINSPGGSVMDGALILSAIQGSRAPVYTVCNLLCASMAAIIFSYGTERYMVDRSILMFHEAAGQLQGFVNHMSSRLFFLNSYVNKMDSYIAQRAGMPIDEFRKNTANELWLEADDAIAKKFADKFVSINIPESSGLLPSLGSKWMFKNMNFKVVN